MRYNTSFDGVGLDDRSHSLDDGDLRVSHSDIAVNQKKANNDSLANSNNESVESGAVIRDARNTAIDVQHSKGKLSAIERLDCLFDGGTFYEVNPFTKHRCANFDMDSKGAVGDGVITGYGRINGKLCAAYAQDFTNIGGSLGEMHAKKISYIMDNAGNLGVPIIGINDSGGARIQEGVLSLGGYGDIFQRNVNLSGVVPQISLIMGPCAGGAVYSPSLTDFVFMVKKTSFMFVTGPDVVQKVTYEKVSQEKLGGSSMHGKVSGIADKVLNNDIELLYFTREFLSFIPSNNRESQYNISSDNHIDQNISFLDYLLPKNSNHTYNVKHLIDAIVDNRCFVELKSEHAPNIVIGFASIGGHRVGIIANQPMVMAGCLDINASRKAARFIRFCDAFNIAIVSLVDVPGFLPGVDQEHKGIITHGAKLLYAYAEATVPKVTLITRKAYGGAYIVMGSKHLGADINLAWPSAEIAVMGADSAVEIIFRKYLHDPLQIQKLTDEYKNKFSNPYFAASHNLIDNIIEPCSTKFHIARSLDILQNKKVNTLMKKHDNLPL